MEYNKKNKFDKKYDIRMARYDEVDEIMQFLDMHWKKGHILARDRTFFEYEMVPDGQVNFVIAKDWSNGEIQGLHGFVPASNNRYKRDAWGSIWKIVPGSMGMLGLEIIKRLEVINELRTCLSIGGNPETTVPLLKYVRHFEDVGKMEHFYCLSLQEEYLIAKVGHKVSFTVNQDYNTNIVQYDNYKQLKEDYDFSNSDEAFPYKDGWYINHRYFENPIYHYLIYGLRSKPSEKKSSALLIAREQKHNGGVALRLVDYIGKAELFAGLSLFFQDSLNRYEYIDFYCYGFNTEYVKRAGMIKIEDNDTNIIPNYFYPYVAQNIDIYVGTPKGRAVFFKADGDQDRPN